MKVTILLYSSYYHEYAEYADYTEYAEYADYTGDLLKYTDKLDVWVW